MEWVQESTGISRSKNKTSNSKCGTLPWTDCVQRKARRTPSPRRPSSGTPSHVTGCLTTFGWRRVPRHTSLEPTKSGNGDWLELYRFARFLVHKKTFSLDNHLSGVIHLGFEDDEASWSQRLTINRKTTYPVIRELFLRIHLLFLIKLFALRLIHVTFKTLSMNTMPFRNTLKLWKQFIIINIKKIKTKRFT